MISENQNNNEMHILTVGSKKRANLMELYLSLISFFFCWSLLKGIQIIDLIVAFSKKKKIVRYMAFLFVTLCQCFFEEFK